MTYNENDLYTYESFFNKFKILDSIEWNMDLIDITIQDAIWNLKKEKIDKAEIKFSINKYLKYINISPNELILWFLNRFDYHASKWNINVDLVLSLKHQMDKQTQIDIANCINNDLIAEYISGIDVVGNENFFCADFYKPIFERWDTAGKACMVHVGEIDRPDNVSEAIKKLPIDRICHGIAAANDKEIAKISRDKQIVFDLCLTSNMFTGVAKKDDHPILKMLENGFLITIGTDDPIIFNTTLDKEYNLFKNITGLSEDYIDLIKSATPLLSANEISKRKQT